MIRIFLATAIVLLCSPVHGEHSLPKGITVSSAAERFDEEIGWQSPQNPKSVASDESKNQRVLQSEEIVAPVTVSELCTTYLPTIEEYFAATVEIDEATPHSDIQPFVCSCNLDVEEEIQLRCTTMFLDELFGFYPFLKEEIILRLDAESSSYAPVEIVSQTGSDVQFGGTFYGVYQTMELLPVNGGISMIASCAFDENMAECGPNSDRACDCTVCPAGDGVNVTSFWYNTTCTDTPNPTYGGPGFFGMLSDPELAPLLFPIKDDSAQMEECADDGIQTVEDFCADLSGIEERFTELGRGQFPINFTDYACVCGEMLDGNLTISCNYEFIDSDIQGVESMILQQEGAYLLPVFVGRYVNLANGTFTQNFDLSYDRQKVRSLFHFSEEFPNEECRASHVAICDDGYSYAFSCFGGQYQCDSELPQRSTWWMLYTDLKLAVKTCDDGESPVPAPGSETPTPAPTSSASGRDGYFFFGLTIAIVASMLF